MLILRILKNTLSWSVVTAGFLIGSLGLALFAAGPILIDYEISRDAWLFILASGILGASSLAGSLAALHKRKLAGGIYVSGALLVGVCGVFSGPFWLTDHRTVTVCTTLLALGGFWFWTHKSLWPHFVTQRKLSHPVKILVWVSVSFILAVIVSVGSIKITLNEEDIGDCGEGWPVSKQYPGRAVFIARVIHFDALLGAVAVVQERFWGLPWYSKLVFLKAPGEPGDVYFVDGRLGVGLLTRHVFPVINMHCTRSTMVQNAKVDLRVIRGGLPQSGVRIIGRAVLLSPRHEAIPGIKVIVDGPQGQTDTMTDEDGIYDIKGLPPGHYKVRAYVHADDELSRSYSSCPDFLTTDLKSGDVWGCTLRVYDKKSKTSN